jgi:long-chain acyl-CoA synthetase
MPSNDEIQATLCAPGQFFEIETVEITGVPTRAWKNAPRTLDAVLVHGAAAAGARDFLVLDEERISHERHLELVERFAASLVELGVRKGDRVAIAMRNLPEWSIAFFGAAMAGAIAVPINAFGTGEELGFAIADADATVVVADCERLERLATASSGLAGRVVIGTRLDARNDLAELPADVIGFGELVQHERKAPAVDIEPDDFATIFYTSGTTTRPKGVLGTHRNICSNLVSMMFSGVRTMLRDDAAGSPSGPPVQLLSVPLFHATGCHSMLVGQAFFGGTLIFMRRWDAEAALDLIERECVTSFSGVPTMLWDVLNSPTLDRRDLSSVGNFGGGGAASPPELVRRIHERFPASGSATGYGLTETSSITASIGGSDYLDRPASVGIPVPICEVRIVAPNGKDATVGEAGEIWTKGANVVPGYWQRPDETQAAFTQGWLHSGDIGRLDDEGFLYIVDRAKDIVIRGGENISTLEVESVLFEHPAVVDAAVFATLHATLGEEVGAVVCVLPGSGVTPEVLREHAAKHLAAHKVPAHVWIVEEPLPRGDTGKVLKRVIQAEYAPLVPTS